MEKIEESVESQNSSGSEQAYDKKLDARVKAERQLVKKDTEKRLSELSCCNKLYLWLRRNYVVDILFRHSDEHLDDIVHQMKSGRTNIKTQIELGLANQAKKSRQQEIEQQLNEIVLQEIKEKEKHSGFEVTSN